MLSQSTQPAWETRTSSARRRGRRCARCGSRHSSSAFKLRLCPAAQGGVMTADSHFSANCNYCLQLELYVGPPGLFL